MAIEGHVQKKAFHPECLDENVERIPDDHFIDFDINALKSYRQFWFKRQVSHLVDQILYHPDRKLEYVQRINELILYEKKIKRRS